MQTTTTYRKKDNGWQVIVSYKQGRTWKQKSKQGFATKSEAKEYEQTLIAQIKKAPRPIDKALKNITLAEFCEEYLANRNSLSYGTKAIYNHAVKSLQSLANKPMRLISFMDLQKAIREWNMASTTQKEYRIKLRVLFRAAIKPYGIISDNPMTDIEIKRTRKEKKNKAIPEDTMQAILNTVNLRITYIALRIAQLTGVRRGELLALTWNDFDFANLTVTVNKQITITNQRQHDVVYYTKSANGFREIPIPAVLAKELKQYRLTSPLSITGELFPKPLAVYYNMCYALNKYHYSPHSLRHTYASKLLAEGVDIQTIAALLGDNVETVTRTYVHYTDEMRKSANEKIQKIFSVNF